MKVVHLSLYDRYGGACIAAYRQHEALRRNGVDSKMWVRFKVTNDPDVLAYRPPKQLVQRLPRILKRRELAGRKRDARILGEMFSAESEYGADILKGMPAADVINVQFGWDFVDYAAVLARLPATVPVVVTMHEMANFTGGCSYAGDCRRFERTCGKCPQLGQRGPADLSDRQWRYRDRAFRSRAGGRLHFVADSHWIAGAARRSGLLKDFPVSVIHYGLDTEIFRPRAKSAARGALNIPGDARVLAFACASWSNERKGMRQLAEALQRMKTKPFLLTWGQNFDLGVSGVHRLHLGSLDSEYFMALAYNAADVFVMPSLEEAFGQTALESIACGTPVAAFASGGIPETVRHEETGLLAGVGDVSGLHSCIERLLDDRSLHDHCSKEGARVAETEFSYARNAETYRQLYSSMTV